MDFYQDYFLFDKLTWCLWSVESFCGGVLYRIFILWLSTDLVVCVSFGPQQGRQGPHELRNISIFLFLDFQFHVMSVHDFLFVGEVIHYL